MQEAHMKEVSTPSPGGLGGRLTITPVMVTQIAIEDGQEIRWVSVEDFDPARHTPRLKVLVAGRAAVFDDKGFEREPEILAQMGRHTRVMPDLVKDGETRMVTIIPSPYDDVGAKPMRVPYDQKLLDDRMDRWPNVRLPAAT